MTFTGSGSLESQLRHLTSMPLTLLDDQTKPEGDTLEAVSKSASQIVDDTVNVNDCGSGQCSKREILRYKDTDSCVRGGTCGCVHGKV